MTASLAPLFRRSVGFDRFDELFDDVLRSEVTESNKTATGYPLYDIVREADGRYRLIMALAGFSENDITVTAQSGKLVIAGSWPKDVEDQKSERQWLHRGIARRAFERSFRLAEHVEVKDARLRNGLLEVALEQVIPEAHKPRKIQIKS